MLAAIECEKGDTDLNLARHLDVVTQAAASGCDLVVFPECSLTGPVDPQVHPERSMSLSDPAVDALVRAAHAAEVAVVFGISEHVRDRRWITQVCASGGSVVGVQRKRHLGAGEEAYSEAPAADVALFELGPVRIASVICAESRFEPAWDMAVEQGAQLICLSSAPGLDERCDNHADWQKGFDWWSGAGLADARRHARRLGVWVAMATQAGSTVDEDFPGLAALIDPTGAVLDRLPDWRPGLLVVDVPVRVVGDPVWLERRKWPDVPHYRHHGWPLGEDEHGQWYELKVGDPVFRGDEVLFHGRHGGLMLVPHGQPGWLAWFLSGRDFDLYVDIVGHVVRSPEAVTMVDLDFDVVRYVDGHVELVDEDEFVEHRVRYGYPDDVAEAAVATSRRVLAAVEAREPPFDDVAARRCAATVGIVLGSS